MTDKLSNPIATMQANQEPPIRMLPEEGSGLAVIQQPAHTGSDEEFLAEFKKVDSSQIDSIAHSGMKLRVRFHNGQVYEYQGVDRELYQKLLEADSVGKMFNAEIKKNAALYPFRKV